MALTQINIPRPLTVAVNEFLPLVKRFRELESAKLVIRLADIETRFDEVLDAMNSYTGWGDVGEWEDVHEYAYMVGCDSVRTYVHISNTVSVTHMTTDRLETLELKLMNYGRARASVQVDTVVDSADIPETVTPSMARVRKRKTFSKSPWRFVVSKMWKGATRSLAEKAQCAGDTLYNIEIEFMPDASYWDMPRHTSTYVATSMLMKMVDIVSSEMISVEPITNASGKSGDDRKR